MRRCIELAKNGLGTTYPNPLVGSVIVHKDNIIGEGWHHQAGQPHAEVNAIKSVKDEELLISSTIYVNLEPCSHHGLTPPCADLIVSKGIPRVVIGSLDPNPKVAGNGLNRLRSEGVEVTEGILAEETDELNKRFFMFHKEKRPYIILKWAESKDGFIAPKHQPKGKPFWLSNRFSKQLSHKLRAEEQAILVGKNTVLKDDPSLTTRLWPGNDPLRIFIDRDLEVPSSHKLYNGTAKTLVFTEGLGETKPEIVYERLDFDKSLPEQIIDKLWGKKIQSLIVEGGAITLQSFIDLQLWDEAFVFQTPIELTSGLKAPVLDQTTPDTSYIKEDKLLHYKNPHS